MKFEENWTSNFREVVQRYGQTEGQTKVDRWQVIIIAHPGPMAQVSLKTILILVWIIFICI